MQDVLGELTHLLYVKRRTGAVRLPKKRKVAWELESSDFESAYLGHAGHYLEASIVNLKRALIRGNEK
ncbi:hypothetical protein C5E05_17560 [Pseudoclavibacter sp. AY1H1]|nr:hypothetical protein C5E05_17560 [Pseudoclavibacter sp. AY1H1]